MGLRISRIPNRRKLLCKDTPRWSFLYGCATERGRRRKFHWRFCCHQDGRDRAAQENSPWRRKRGPPRRSKRCLLRFPKTKRKSRGRNESTVIRIRNCKTTRGV